MTYGRLMATVSGLLTGDIEYPENEDQRFGLLEMAFGEVATHAEAMHLMTLNRDNEITRLGAGAFVVRTPNMPDDESSEIDIDEELCPALARILASYVSEKKGPMHYQLGRNVITAYNAKVYELLESVGLTEESVYEV